MQYYSLAFLIGLVLLLTVRVTVKRLVYKSTSDKDLQSKPLFKACVYGYIIGNVLFWFGGTLLVAYTIKDFIY